jgi:hypothetical protein
MKKIGFLIFFSTLAFSAFGQQFLWSTVQDSDTRYVSLNNVIKEVMNFYDQYDYYYDFSGFDKNTFIDKFENNDDSWEWIYEIDSMTVIAMRTYIESIIGGGSAVYIICIDNDSIDLIVFSSVYDTGCTTTSSYRRDRFQNWFRALLN